MVKLYVYFFAGALLLLAVAIAFFKLPRMEAAEHHIGQVVNDSLWKHPNLILGAIGIFVYVGGEVAIGSSISNYLALDNIGHFISPSVIPDSSARYHAALGEAARYISFYWLGAMIGRFIGSALLQKIKAGTLLAICGVAAALLVTISVLANGHVAMWSILTVGLFNSIMFPCIFTLGIAELGPLTGDGSGILNMAIVGGAVIPWLVGQVADLINRSYYPAMIQGETSWGQGIHYALIIRHHLLSLHSVLRCQRIETEQRAPCIDLASKNRRGILEVRATILALLAVISLSLIPALLAPDAALAPTPPMGWNSWNKFGCNVSEDLIRQTADAMVKSGMKDAGLPVPRNRRLLAGCTRPGRQNHRRSAALPFRNKSSSRLHSFSGPEVRHLFGRW